MKILVTAPDTFTGADLKVGCYYNAEPASEGTGEQNRAFHSLLQEFWRSGCHSYNARNFPHFRELIKRDLGAGSETYYEIVDDQGNPCEPYPRRRIKSWSNYTKKERKETIDRLIATMHEVGVQSKKFYEILEGMKSNV